MARLWRSLALITLLLLIPIVPFVLFGASLEEQVLQRFERDLSPALAAVLLVLTLATDILLPIPSGPLSTLGGAKLGVVIGTLCSWLGMSLGTVLGFALARKYGWQLAKRLSPEAELHALAQLGLPWAGWLLVLTRGLPVLAEASVLLLGTLQLPWRRFWLPVLLSNLGLALVYSVAGAVAQAQDALLWAVAASVVLPLAATGIARLCLSHQTKTAGEPPAEPTQREEV